MISGMASGHYRVLEKLGSGGMGVVYKAMDTRLGRMVALKFLPEDLARRPKALERFRREARAASALNHPNICTIHDIDETEGRPFIVMELLQGRSLKELLRGEPLPLDQIISFSMQVAGALEAAHSKGMIHRDIKPGNIFIIEHPHGHQAKILDFGLAKWVLSEEVKTEHSGSTILLNEQITDHGLLGTPAYMSPEQTQGHGLDARTDLFSFGAVMFEMATGRPAFAGSTLPAVFGAILSHAPKAVSRHNPEVPPALDRIVSRALHKSCIGRYQSANELLHDLERLVTSQSRTRRASASLAVLPFENASKDPDEEYLSEGLTENIINTLSQLPRLRVVPRSTVFRFKGTKSDPQEIGRELHVKNVLTGRVLQRGDTLVVSAELIDVPNESQIWGGQYNRQSSAIFAIQDEIAREISEKVKLKITGEDKKKISKRYTHDPDAYKLYLRGRYQWNKRLAADFEKAIDYFQKAIDIDPAYALAYSGLADAFNNFGVYRILSPKIAFARAQAAATRALELDETLPEAHTSMAMVRFWHQWDWASGEREFQRSIDLNPNYATAHHWYALSLPATGNLSKALSEIEKAEALDPLSLGIGSTAAYILYVNRRYDEAIDQCRKTLDLDSGFALTHYCLGLACIQKGLHPEAISALERAVLLSNRLVGVLAALAHAYAAAGRMQDAVRVLEELKQASKSRYVSPYDLCCAYSGMGRIDEAFECVEKAFGELGWLSYLQFEPMLDALKSDPRFNDALRRIERHRQQI